MGRIIGIRHRRKRTAEGEAHPTQVAILEDGEIRKLELADDTAELDFALGRFPVKRRKVFGYDGLRAGDTVAMVLGGSGDRFAYALSARGETIGALVLRVPSFELLKHRTHDKDRDAENLLELAGSQPELFYPTHVRDRAVIVVRERHALLRDAMKERIACQQRLYQSAVGEIFCSGEGLYPEGSVEQAAEAVVASDAILQGLVSEEKRREKNLTAALKQLDVYTGIFEPIEGVGPRISSRLIASIVDIRRFPTKATLKAYCGVHLAPDGSFVRRRRGAVANWSEDARQALYLLSEIFFMRPESEWGKRLRQQMATFRAKHPVVLCKVHQRAYSVCKDEKAKGCKQAYNDLHIRRMAEWRIATKFVERLWKEWWTLAGQERSVSGRAVAS